MSIHHVRLQRRRRSNSSNQANGAKVPPFVLKKLVPSSASVSPRRFPMVLKLLIVGLVLFGLLGLSAIGVAAGVYFNYARQLEGMLVPLETRILSETTKIYDRNGYLLYEIFEEGRRTRLTSLEQVPEALIEATIAVEDKTFFTNPGVDPQGILRAAILILQSGEIQGGGSTLTQQFIRNALFPPEERYAQTMDRKIKEGILSLELTRTYSKEEILLMFFNEISYGNLAYGVEAAAQSYFGKHVWELDLAECAFLAGLPQSPTGYNPFFEGGLERSRARQWDVLNLMAENDFITRAQADAAYNEELHFEAPVISIEAPHFVMYVRQLLEQDPEIGIDKLYGGGLSVYTTLDIRYQRLAEAIIRDWLDPYELNPEHQNMRDYNVNNGAMVVMRPDTGEILAMVGSVDYNLVKPSRCGRETNVVDGNVNAALALRQPGSSFKPFTYLNAFLKGWAPSTMVLDVRTEFPVPGHPAYEPHNHDNKFHGPLSVRVALGSSENVPAVKAIQFAGVGETIDLAHQMGIKGLGDPSFYGLSLTLGGGEVRLLDMVTAYGTLANAGRYVPNQSILRIEDAAHNVLYQYAPLPLEEQPEVVDPNYVHLVTDILSDDSARYLTYGTHGIFYLSEPTAVKTGTSEDWCDNWTIGYTPYVVAGVWVGNNNNEPMTLNCAPRSLARVGMPSSRTAGRVWRYFMENLFNAEDNLLTYFDDETAAAMFGQGQLRYAHYDGESWQIETVDQEGWVGAHTSLALDRTGYPHISYCSYGQFSESCTTLKYAHYDGASWQIETVDEANTGAYSSLALDRGGHPHISYYSEPDAELFYATHDGSRWQITRLDQDLGQDGGYTALALDRRGRPHISYYDGMSRSIKYASLSGSDWKIETIEEGVPHGALSMDTSLALDRVDQPHVAYPDVAHGQLKHAYRSGPVWRVEVVDSSERLGDYAAMVLDQEDQPHISYCLYDPDLQACTTLKYAHYNREEQGWQIEIIEEGAEVGDYNRIALDDEDRPHISYYDTDYQDLKYTYGSDSGWRTQWLDEEDWMGRYSSIQLDAQGRPHISYLGAPEPDLRDILRDEEGKLQYDFDRPSGVVNVEVCALSGKLPGPHCPVTSEVFVEGNQPRETCSIHKALTVVQVPGSDPPQYCLPAPGVVYPPELFQEVVFTDLHSVARIEEIAGLEEWMVEVGLPRVPTDYCPAEWGTVPGGPGQPPDNRWAGLMREISIPWRYQGIDGPIEIRGSANLVSSRPQDQFAGYRLEWGLKILATWPTEWNLIYESNVPVQNGVLAYWDPGNLPDGSYALRLTVLTKEGRPKFDGDAPGHTYRPFYIDRGGIFARIIEPLPGSLLTRSKTTIAVKVEGVAPARRVDFFYDGIFIGTAVTNTVMPLSERVYTITWPVRPGEHDLTVEVVNTAGRKTSSQPVLVFGQPPQGALPQQPARVVAVQPSPALPPRDVRRSPR